MGAGTNVVGFGGGLARGLANVFSRKRQTDQEQANIAQQRKDRIFGAILPVLMENAQEPADLQPFFESHYPEMFGTTGKGKKGGSPFDQLAQFIGPALGGGGSTDDQGPPVPADVAATMPAAPAQPAQRTLLGVPVLSNEQKIDREVRTKTAVSEGLMKRAETVILPALKAVDPDATIYDAMRILGVRADAPQDRTITPAKLFQDQLTRKATELGRALTAEEVGQLRKQWEENGGANGIYRFGQDREALAKSIFDKPFGNLTQQESAIVIREEQAMLGKEAESRASGTGQGRFTAPADLRTAQQTGVPVGTSAADVAGQAVPTQPQAERRRSVETLKTELSNIKNLLGVLPKEGELGALAPGAAYALRRRNPAYRNDIAKLESAINNVVNVMARSVGEQRGTQTERDALRAEAAIAQIRDAFLTGDTQESANARIDQSLLVLDSILNALPATPVQTKTPTDGKPKGSAPAGGPTGMTMKDGKLYINGVLMPGQP